MLVKVCLCTQFVCLRHQVFPDGLYTSCSIQTVYPALQHEAAHQDPPHRADGLRPEAGLLPAWQEGPTNLPQLPLFNAEPLHRRGAASGYVPLEKVIKKECKFEKSCKQKYLHGDF